MILVLVDCRTVISSHVRIIPNGRIFLEKLTNCLSINKIAYNQSRVKKNRLVTHALHTIEVAKFLSFLLFLQPGKREIVFRSPACDLRSSVSGFLSPIFGLRPPFSCLQPPVFRLRLRLRRTSPSPALENATAPASLQGLPFLASVIDITSSVSSSSPP